MTREQIMVELFEFSAPTYYKWTLHQKRKIFDLLDYAFTQDELIEYIKTGKIKNIENKSSFEVLKSSAMNFIKTLGKNIGFENVHSILDLFVEHYKNNSNNISLELFAQNIYSINKIFHKTDIKEAISIKYRLINCFNKESLTILQYICENLSSIKEETDKYLEEISIQSVSFTASDILLYSVNDVCLDLIDFSENEYLDDPMLYFESEYDDSDESYIDYDSIPSFPFSEDDEKKEKEQ